MVLLGQGGGILGQGGDILSQGGGILGQGCDILGEGGRILGHGGDISGQGGDILDHVVLVLVFNISYYYYCGGSCAKGLREGVAQMLGRDLRARLRACARLFASVAQELAHTLRKYFLLGTFSIQHSTLNVDI